MERKPPRAFDAPSDENADAQAPASLAATFPFYEEGKVPQYQRYHAEVSYLDELPLIWGKRWGAQGIGRLREVAMVKPTLTEVRKLYEQARIFVFPSIRENFPMVLLEAMDAGCAVITTDAEGCAEVVGGAGVVIARGDPDALRVAMLALMNDVPLCDMLSRSARARAQLFRWPRICTQFGELFATVAHRAGARSRSLLLAR